MKQTPIRGFYSILIVFAIILAFSTCSDGGGGSDSPGGAGPGGVDGPGLFAGNVNICDSNGHGYGSFYGNNWLYEGKQLMLTAWSNFYNSDYSVAEWRINNNVIWSSDNPAVATVSTNGTFTAVAPGIATITVTTTDGVCQSSCQFIICLPITGITLNKTTMDLDISEKETLTFTVTRIRDTDTRYGELLWSSSNTAVATVSNSGDVTGVAPGTAIITVTTKDFGDGFIPDVSASCTVTVTGTPTWSINLRDTSSNPLTAYTFPATIQGYTIRPTQQITVSNTGNQETGTLNVALSGTNASSFTLSETSLTSIIKGNTRTFTVRPNAGLTAGTYTATVTVSGTNIASKSFSVSFTVNPPASYGISLSETGTYTFPAATQGYGTQDARTITVSNTGNQATGSLNIALTGTNASSFTLSATSLASIATGSTRTFTIRPNNSLTAGTYTATVTVSGTNVASQSFNVSFTVNPPASYGISLSETGTYTFPSAIAGYGTQNAQTITVTNTGNQATGNLNISVLATASRFTLSATSLTSIAAGSSSTFTIRPNNGLAAGTYTATVTVSGTNVASQSFNISFTVLQNVPNNRFEYYWIDAHDSLVTTSGGATSVAAGQTLTITAQSTGYTVQQWRLNGVNTGQSGNTFNFSSTTPGRHIVGLFVEKDGKLYNTNITITVQ